jgi:hypothetical protein
VSPRADLDAVEKRDSLPLQRVVLLKCICKLFVGSYEQVNTISGPINGEEFLGWLSEVSDFTRWALLCKNTRAHVQKVKCSMTDLALGVWGAKTHFSSIFSLLRRMKLNVGGPPDQGRDL